MNNEHFRLAFDQAPVGVAIVGLDSTVLRVNNLFCSILGFTPDELTNILCSEIPSLKGLLACVERAARTADGSPAQHTVEQCYVRRDGCAILLSVSASLVRDEQGLPLHFLCFLRDITGSKGAVEQSRLLSQVLNDVRNSVIVTDPAGAIIYWNRHAEEMYGWEASEAVGRNVAELGLAAYTDEERAAVWKIVRAGQSVEKELVGRRRDGSTFPAYATSVPIMDDSGQLTAVGSIVIDITRRKQADEALHRSEERLRTLAGRIPDIIYRYRLAPEYGFEYVSPSVTSVLGYTADEIYADPLLTWKIVHPDDQHVLGPIFDPTPPLQSTFALRCIRKDERLVWLEWRQVPIYDEAGQIVAFEGIARDVTEQKQIEERLERITRASHDWLWEYDAREHKMWWNRPRREAMGLSEGEEPTLEMWAASIHPDDRERVVSILRKLEGDQKPSWVIEYRIQVADGTYRTVLDRGTNIFDDAGKLVRSHGALTDISERRYVEETLHQREALLRAVIDTFPFPVWGRDRQGRMIIQNAISRRWWHNQLDTDFDESPLDPALLAEWKDHHLRALLGEVVQVESRHTIHDEPRYLHEVIAPILDGGETIGTVGMQMEITKRKRAEADLRNSEARFRAVWESTVDAMTLSDLDGTVILGNPAYYRFHGYAPGQVLGKPFTTIFPEDVRAEAMATYLAMLEIPVDAFETEFQVQRADGDIRTVSTGISFIEREGQRVLVLSVMRDMTDFRQAEEAIRQANETLLRHAERISTLNRISQVVSTEAYMPSALNVVGKTLADIFKASEVTISLLDSEHSTLRILTQATKAPGKVATIVKGAEGRTTRLEDDEMASHAIVKKQPTLYSDRRTSPSLSEEWLQLGSMGAHNLIAVPLRARGNVVGLLSISSDEAGRSFNSTEAAWLQTIAGSIASAIETARLLTQEQQQRAVSESLREVVAALASSLDRETVVRTIFDQLGKVLRYRGAGIYLSKHGRLVLAEAAGYAKRYVDHKVPLSKDGPPQLVHKSRQPLLIEDAAGSPHWHLPETPEESLSWMGAPLVAGSKAIGVLAVCNCEGERYTQMDLEVLEMFAQHAATAFANSLHYEQAHAHAADDERNRIARELHDSVTQGLFSASLIADVLPELAGQDPVKVREGLTTLRRLTRGALAEMRALLLELRPADLQSVRLNVAIGHLATMATLQGTLTVETDLERIPLLPGKVQVSLYRIAQEALNNIMKHAQARHVRVALRAEPPVDEGRQTTYDGSIHSDQGKQAMDDRRRTADGGGDRGDVIWRGKIILEINDDGVGFEPERVEEGHMGLSIMRERAREVKAHLRITSAPGKGSKVMATWEDGGTRSQGRESGWQLAVGN